MINPIVDNRLPNRRARYAEETGKVGKTGSGSVMLAWETPCCWLLFAPLTVKTVGVRVELEEKFKDISSFPGGFTKREGKLRL